MISSAGRQLASTFGLSVHEETGILFGELSGYRVFITEKANQRMYDLVFPACPAGDAPVQAAGDFLESFKRGRKGISGAMAEEYALHIAVRMRGYKKTSALFHEIFQAVTAYLQENHFLSCCMACGETESTGLYVLDCNAGLFCETCANRAAEYMKEEAERITRQKSRLPLGLLGAFLGSLVGVAAWVLVYQLGYIAGIVGLLMLICAMKGYQKLGGCLDVRGVIATVILSVAMVFVSLYLCVGIEVYQAYGSYGFFECLMAVPAALSANGLLPEFIGDLLIGYLFMGAAGYRYIADAVRASHPQKELVRIL